MGWEGTPHLARPLATLSLGRGLSSLVGVGAIKTALALGERVSRDRRFHQPERDG